LDFISIKRCIIFFGQDRIENARVQHSVKSSYVVVYEIISYTLHQLGLDKRLPKYKMLEIS